MVHFNFELCEEIGNFDNVIHMHIPLFLLFFHSGGCGYERVVRECIPDGPLHPRRGTESKAALSFEVTWVYPHKRSAREYERHLIFYQNTNVSLMESTFKP